MVLTLAIFGCSQSEESKPAEEQTKTTTEKVGEANETAEGEMKESAENVAEETKQMAAATADKTEEMADQTAEASKEMMADTKEATKEAADTAAEKAQSAAVATTTAADKAVDAAKQAVSPETIVLEASYGNVTFPHALHQDSYECSICHGEGTPGLFGLDKDKAHALCRDCHKQEGAGPTGCKDCHKK
jgi:uncharacterized phage infection (PIP) family protein YhgE